MKSGILSKVDEHIKKYQTDHQGEKPLYILVSTFEAKDLWDAVRRMNRLDSEVSVTTYKGSKIVENDSLKMGDLLLTNELPESGS